jgi:hypothetical protein
VSTEALRDEEDSHRDQVRPSIQALAGKFGLRFCDLLLEQISGKDADHWGENCNIGCARDDYFCGVAGR